MKLEKRFIPGAIFLVALLAVALVAAVPASPAASPEQAKAQPTAKADGDYVGSEACLACHEDQQRRFKNTIMGKIMARPRTPEEGRGCESCHGPGDRKSVV